MVFSDQTTNRYALVIFSNQSGVEKQKVNLSDLQGKILDICNAVGVPIQAFLAISSDYFRKPNPAMWNLFVSKFNGSKLIDLNSCFYIGVTQQTLLFHSSKSNRFFFFL